MSHNPHPIYLLSRCADARDRLCAVAPGRHVEQFSGAGSLDVPGEGFAIVVVEHSENGLDGARVAETLADMPGRSHLHVLVVDPDGAQEPFASLDAGADDYVADAIDGKEFAFRIEAADGALDLLEDGTHRPATLAIDARPLEAAELAPSREPREVLTAAAREAARLTLGESGFVFRFQDSVAIAESAWGVEQLAPGAVFDLLEMGCLPDARRKEAPARVNLTPRPLGREQSLVSYIRPVYRSGLAVPLRLGTAIWGAMMVGRTSPKPFTADEAAALERFADRAAVTIGIAERRARLERLSVSDLQTGLLRREAFEDLFREDFASRKESVGLALFRIEDLSRMRTEHGRSASEHLLAEVGARLTLLNRAGDLQARWSEDEMVWLLDEADLDLTLDVVRDAVGLFTGGRMRGLGPVDVVAGSAASTHPTMGELIARARRGLPAQRAFA